MGRRRAGDLYPNPSRVHACMPFGYDPDPPWVLAKNKNAAGPAVSGRWSGGRFPTGISVSP